MVLVISIALVCVCVCVCVTGLPQCLLEDASAPLHFPIPLECLQLLSFCIFDADNCKLAVVLILPMVVVLCLLFIHKIALR